MSMLQQSGKLIFLTRAGFALICISCVFPWASANFFTHSYISGIDLINHTMSGGFIFTSFIIAFFGLFSTWSIFVAPERATCAAAWLSPSFCIAGLYSYIGTLSDQLNLSFGRTWVKIGTNIITHPTHSCGLLLLTTGYALTIVGLFLSYERARQKKFLSEYFTQKDDRQEPRLAIEISAVVTLDNEIFFCKAKDLSESGARLELFQKIQEGVRLLVHLCLTQDGIKIKDSSSVSLPSEVVWAECKDEKRWEIGVKFIEMSEETKQLLGTSILQILHNDNTFKKPYTDHISTN